MNLKRSYKEINLEGKTPLSVPLHELENHIKIIVSRTIAFPATAFLNIDVYEGNKKLLNHGKNRYISHSGQVRKTGLTQAK